MNKKDLGIYKKKLIKEKEFLVEQLNIDRLQIKDFSKVEVGDIIDKAYNSYEKSRTIDMSENQKKMLHAIENALERIEKNTYGLCMRCGEKISKERLDSIPWVSTCMRKTCIAKAHS